MNKYDRDRIRAAAALADAHLDGRDSAPNGHRREILRAAVGLAACSMLPGYLRAQTARQRFVAYPFTLGVASGYPTADGVSLWTRLAPLPLQADGGIGRDEVLPVRWQVAEDERFGTIVAEGQQRAVSELAHSVHVDVRGLRPARGYFYRFLCGDEVSRTGRRITAPEPGAKADRLRFAIGSCQHYEQGYFAAYRHLLDDAPDLMLFLGDYIYESSWGDDLVRRHAGGEPYDLGEYRVRHAQYKADPDLQRAHAAMPWLVTWDDHEVDNDPARDQSEHLDPRFLLRRAAAYQAYYEHMPLPATMRPQPDGRLRLHSDIGWGALARIVMLDGRQYRDLQACPDPFKGGGGRTIERRDCAGIDDPQRSLLGAAQERWLDGALRTGGRRWNVLAQQTLMSARDDEPGPGRPIRTDGWDGYPRTREAVFDMFERHRVANPLVVGGDIHATVLADLKRDPWNPRSAILANEVCGTSIASQGAAQADFDRALANNPQFHVARSDRRDYCLLTLSRDTDVQVRALETVKRRNSGIETLARYAIEGGKPGLQRA
jgi:alkaline phosphatase D